MDYLSLAKKYLALAEKEFPLAEIFITSKKSLSISYENEHMDSYELAEEIGLQLKVGAEQKFTQVYSERLDEEAFQDLLKTAKEALSIMPEDQNASIYAAADDEELLSIPEPPAFNLEPAEIKELLLKVTSKTREHCPETKLASATYSHREGQTILVNSKGLERQAKQKLNLLVLYLIVSRDGEMKNGLSFQVLKSAEDLDLDFLVADAAHKALRNYGARSIKSASYPIILDADNFAMLLSSFATNFSADTVQKGQSLFKGLLGEKVASPLLSIVDDPLCTVAPLKSNFDGEGVPQAPLALIEDGVLKNYLHNLKTAKKAGVKPSGNAQRTYQSISSPGLSTLVVKAGTDSVEDLLAKAEGGLYITDLQGFHSGLNPISGDFSLPANGFLIENGQLARPVNQITIAGNFYELLKNITALGNEPRLTLNMSYVPEVLISELSVAGDGE